VKGKKMLWEHRLGVNRKTEGQREKKRKGGPLKARFDFE